MSGLQSGKSGLDGWPGKITAHWRMAVPIAVALLLAGCPAFAQVRNDEAASEVTRSHLDSLGRLLGEYTETLVSYGTGFKGEECDAIIASCHDTLTRNYTARYLFRHYRDSPLMGDEGVAIHLYDRWFRENGRDTVGYVRFENDDEAFSARIFANANRQSLLGMRAPGLILSDIEGNTVSLFGDEQKAASLPAADGRLKVLYFYATDCAVCKLYSRQLQVLLSNSGQKLDFISVYTGRDRESWERYVYERLSWEAANVRHFKLWDAEGNGGFVTRYGVLSTPRLFLIDENGLIVGRRLDPEALRMLLATIEQDDNYAYGDKESRALFEGLLPADDLGIPAITGTMELIHRISQDKGNPAIERHMTGDLLYYLNSHEEEKAIEACDWFIREYILSDKIAWKGRNDSLCVLHLAEFVHELRSKAPIGSPVPAVNAYIEEIVPAYASKSGKTGIQAARTGLTGKFRLDRLKKRCRFKKREMIFLFYDPACSECKDQIAKVREGVAGVSGKGGDAPAIILIDVEENTSRLSEKEQDALLEAFDLSSLPYLIHTSPDGTITRRYFKF